jgi:hypothetical protein
VNWGWLLRSWQRQQVLYFALTTTELDEMKRQQSPASKLSGSGAARIIELEQNLESMKVDGDYPHFR